jgi:hypothetical protein
MFVLHFSESIGGLPSMALQNCTVTIGALYTVLDPGESPESR